LDIDQEKLKALYRAGTQPGDRSACPGSEELLRGAEGRLESAARARFAAHLTACSACAAEFRLAAELEPWADRTARNLFPGARAISTLPRPRSRFAEALLAAAAVVVVALGVVYFRDRGSGASPAPTVRGDRPASWTSVTPIDGAIMTGAPSRLSWPGVDGAAAYELTLFDAESTLVWQSERLVSPAIDLPPTAGDKLGAGGTFFWRVTAFRPGERVLSPLMRFEVRP
jgi:anti-sigma factor RsiW